MTYTGIGVNDLARLIDRQDSKSFRNPKRLFSPLSHIILQVITIAILLNGCSLIGNGLCNKDVVARVKNTRVSDLPPMITIMDLSEESFRLLGAEPGSMKWKITSKDESNCIVTLTGKQNGQRVEGFVWLVDMNQERVSPYNYNAQAMTTASSYGGNTYVQFNSFSLAEDTTP